MVFFIGYWLLVITLPTEALAKVGLFALPTVALSLMLLSFSNGAAKVGYFVIIQSG